MSKRVSLPSIQTSPQWPDIVNDGSNCDICSEEPSSSDLRISPSRNELRKRLASMAAHEGAASPQALKFIHNTKARERTRERQQPIKLEPLPALKIHQSHKQPEYIYRKNRERLLAGGVLQPITSAEKMKWPVAVETLVPEIPEEFREIQLLGSKILPTPAKQPRSTVKISACLPNPIPPAFPFQEAQDVVKANVTEPQEIIKIVCGNKHLGFLYMTPAMPRSSIEYDAYNLKIVTYDCINKNDYYTISPNAVIHTCNGEVEYLELARWEQEYLYHRSLSKIPIFAIFRKWKSFNVWRKNVRSKKINSCRRALQKNLFIVNPSIDSAESQVGDVGMFQQLL
ncbi:dynein axonemal heavy chain 6-like [Sphaerodactylus townsendi]|uniref:dynein axonemal heavy chain 6-like n=1 Tax=Sphaerodactylus townsendi TaxID=933632 RepID=UPI002026B9C7|nr:dynein axonemal heavy chain 6-like [Sphaerodactylus townsendi]